MAGWSPNLRCRAEAGRTFDIGGPDILTYRDMMQRYARVTALPERLILPVPMLTSRAWLETTVGRDAHGRTVYGQRALFHPHGLTGHAYGWSVSPLHAVVFGGMARNIAAAAAAERAAV